jgi:hypothetical protein
VFLSGTEGREEERWKEGARGERTEQDEMRQNEGRQITSVPI